MSKKKSNYFKEVYDELVVKTSWPTWPQLQNSAIVVMVATVIISIVVFAMDQFFGLTLTNLYTMIN